MKPVKRTIFIGLGKNGVQMLLKTSALLGVLVPAETRLLQYLAVDYQERLESVGNIEGINFSRVFLRPAEANEFDRHDRERVAKWLPLPLNEAMESLNTGESKTGPVVPGEFIQVFEAEDSVTSRRWFGRLTFYQNFGGVRSALTRACKQLYWPENYEAATRAGLELFDDGTLQVVILADLNEPLVGGALLDLAYLVQERAEAEILPIFNQSLSLSATLALPFTSSSTPVEKDDLDSTPTFKTVDLRDEKFIARQAGVRGAQAYATLDDLSRYLDGQPYEMAYGDGTRIHKQACPPFTAPCYLVSSQNESGAELAGPDKVHDLVAMWWQYQTLGHVPLLPVTGVDTIPPSPTRQQVTPTRGEGASYSQASATRGEGAKDSPTQTVGEGFALDKTPSALDKSFVSNKSNKAYFSSFGHYSLVLPIAELSQHFKDRLCHETVQKLIAQPTIPLPHPSQPDLNPYIFENLTNGWLSEENARPELTATVLEKMPLSGVEAERFLLEQTAIQTGPTIRLMEERCFGRAATQSEKLEQLALASVVELLAQTDYPVFGAVTFANQLAAEMERGASQAQAAVDQLEAGVAATISQLNQFRPAFLTALQARPTWVAFVGLGVFSLMPLITFAGAYFWLALFTTVLAAGVGGAILQWLMRRDEATRLKGWELYRQLVDLAGRRVLALAAVRFYQEGRRIAQDTQSEVEILRLKLARTDEKFEAATRQNETLNEAIKLHPGDLSAPLLRMRDLDRLYYWLLKSPGAMLPPALKPTGEENLFNWRNLGEADISDRLQLYANQKLERLQKLTAVEPLLELNEQGRGTLLQKACQLAQPYWLCRHSKTTEENHRSFLLASPGLENEPILSQFQYVETTNPYQVTFLTAHEKVSLSQLPQVEGLRHHYEELTRDNPRYREQLHIIP